MKKQFISFFFALIVLVVITSCGNKNSSQQTEPTSTEQTAVDTTESSQSVAAVYQCPMKCEGEKTYDKPGKCPKCNMDLKEKEGHEEHEH
jgi:predicted small lipoprotein YifL